MGVVGDTLIGIGSINWKELSGMALSILSILSALSILSVVVVVVVLMLMLLVILAHVFVTL